MSYFKDFPLTRYKFGNNLPEVYVQDISIYVDLLDQLSDATAFYQKYTILDGDRPDTLSYKLYGTTDYHWTFYLLNPTLRESGWPLSYKELESSLETAYPGIAFTISEITDYLVDGVSTPISEQTLFDTKFAVGNKFTTNGSPSINVEVAYRNLDYGTIVLRPVNTADRELLQENADGYDGLIDNIQKSGNVVDVYDISDFDFEYETIHHYENSSGEWVDVVYSQVTPGTTAYEDRFNYTAPIGSVPVTVRDNLQAENDEAKVINIFKPSIIPEIVSQFKKVIKG